MRKTNLIKLGDAIDQLFKQEKLDIKISQHAIKNNWKDIVGDIIANSTSEIYFNESVIFVTMTSAALKHDLSYKKETILDTINKYCGYKLVNQLVIK